VRRGSLDDVKPRWSLVGLLAASLAAASCDAEEEPSTQSTSDEQDLVGGSAESRFRAVGYISATGSDDVLCGATLIARNVAVTAAHCVDRSRDEQLQFGVGEVGDRVRYGVASIHVHPDAHLESQGDIDLVHTLLLYDLAYLLLDEPVADVEPARLSTAKPKHGQEVQLVAYGPLANDSVRRKGVRGRVVLNANLAGDTIVEIAPRDGGAVCHRDGDEGHAAVLAGDGGVPVLVGVYVGSVTQSFSDCRKYLQYLNGYEATFGYLAFYQEGIDAGAAKLAEQAPP
jgi:phosphohistidine swiveling domain-containing protein